MIFLIFEKMHQSRKLTSVSPFPLPEERHNNLRVNEESRLSLNDSTTGSDPQTN